jgi:hypothetical protein
MQELIGMWWLFVLTGIVFVIVAFCIARGKSPNKYVISAAYILAALIDFMFAGYLLLQVKL